MDLREWWQENRRSGDGFGSGCDSGTSRSFQCSNRANNKTQQQPFQGCQWSEDTKPWRAGLGGHNGKWERTTIQSASGRCDKATSIGSRALCLRMHSHLSHLWPRQICHSRQSIRRRDRDEKNGQVAVDLHIDAVGAVSGSSAPFRRQEKVMP